MAQLRVTSFFPQKKKSGAQEATRRKGPRAGSVSGDKGEGFLPSTGCSTPLSSSCSKSIHRDFVRNIAAATEVVGEETDHLSDSVGPVKPPPSPVTPKRTSVDAGLGSVTSAARNHSTAKKRRQLEASNGAQEDRKTERKTARKRLLLPKNEVLTSVTFTTCFLWI